MPRHPRTLAIDLTVPQPEPHVNTPARLIRYLEYALTRYFKGGVKVTLNDDDESITVTINKFQPLAGIKLVCRPGSDDDWYSFTNEY